MGKSFVYIWITLSVLIMSSVNSFSGDIIFDFDFETSEFVLSWDNPEGDYLIEAYQVIYTDCVKESVYLGSYDILQYVPNEEVRASADLGKFEIFIYYYNGGIKGALYSSREVFVDLTTENYEMAWCPITFDEEIHYNVYYKALATDSYEAAEYIRVPSTQTSYSFLNMPAFEKVFRVVTSETTLDLISSDYSNEVIFFTALPSDLKNLKIEFD